MNKNESNHGPKITSYGAVGGLVTGSCHIYESRDSRINIDFGLFQGKLEEKDQLEVLNQKIIELSQCIVDTKLELEQQKIHAEINYQALEKQLTEQQKSTKKLISKGFFSRLFYVVKGGR